MPRAQMRWSGQVFLRTWAAASRIADTSG